MCLKASTSKANEIHEYYIKLEETLHELIDEESNVYIHDQYRLLTFFRCNKEKDD